VDSLGRLYKEDISFDDDDLVLEKVSLSLVDDLTVGDAVNLFSLHESNYRPFLTYRARIALDGSLIHAPSGTTISMPRPGQIKPNQPGNTHMRRNGRPTSTPPGKRPKAPYTNPQHNLKKDTDKD
jgi:hypothetical protein